MVLQRAQVQQAGARHVGHGLALGGGEPGRADQPQLLVHHPVDVDRQIAGDGPDVDGDAAAGHRPHARPERLVRGTRAEGVDVDVGAVAAGLLADPVVERPVVQRVQVQPATGQLGDLVEQGLVPAGAVDVGEAHGGREEGRGDAQGAADAVDEDRLARTGLGLAQRRVHGADVAEAGGCLEGERVRQLHQAVRRGHHVLGEAALVAVEQVDGGRGEAEVAGEGVACAVDRVAAAT